MKDVVEELKKLGLNSYESKVYIALLKKYPATGYEVSQNADIPQSRAYDALKSLASEDIVIADDQKPQRFTPIPPKELTKRFRRSITSTLDYLEKKLPNVKEDYNVPLHNIAGYENILNKIKEIIKGAKHSLYIEIWNEEYKLIENEIKEAYERDVDIKLVAYGDIKTNYALVYQHSGGKELENSTNSRLIYLLADSEECLFGRMSVGVVWTKNRDVAFLLKEFIVHDMYLLDVGLNFPEQLKYFYGAGFKRLKTKLLSKDTKYNIH